MATKRKSTKKSKAKAAKKPKAKQLLKKLRRAQGGVAGAGKTVTVPLDVATVDLPAALASIGEPVIVLAPPVTRLGRPKATAGEKLASKLVRALRVHAKRPYGKRGMDQIVKLAREAAHLLREERPTTDR